MYFFQQLRGGRVKYRIKCFHDSTNRECMNEGVEVNFDLKSIELTEGNENKWTYLDLI